MFARKKNPYPLAVLLVRSQTSFRLEWHTRWPCQQKLFLNTKLVHLRHSWRIKFFLLHHTYVGFTSPSTSWNHCHNTKSFREAGRILNTVITGSSVISLGLNHTKAAVCKPQPQNMPGSFAKQSALMSPCSLECSPAKTSCCSPGQEKQRVASSKSSASSTDFLNSYLQTTGVPRDLQINGVPQSVLQYCATVHCRFVRALVFFHVCFVTRGIIVPFIPPIHLVLL